MQTYSFSNIDKFSTAGLVTRMTTDVTNVQNAYQMIIRIAVRAPLMLICSMAMCFAVSGSMSTIFLAAIVLLGIVLGIIVKKTMKVFTEAFKKYDDLNASIQENVSAIRVVKAYVREDFEQKKFKKASGNLYKMFVKAESLIALNSPVMMFVIYSCIMLISWLGAKNVVAGTMTTGELSSVFTYVISAMMSLMMLSMVFLQSSRAMASIRRIDEVLDEPIDLSDENASQKDRKVEKGRVEFKDVSFSYREGGEPVLSHISLTAEPGETIGILGATGSGKTYLVKTLAKLLDVPLAIADATALTEARYIGDDIESVVSKLLAAAGNDVEKAEHGIIFIDEIDKIAKKKNTMSRDVSGESVQQELLKLLEGSQVEVPVGSNQKNALTPMATVDTNNILFICGGAFPGLDDIIKERLKKRSTMGFNSHLKDEFDNDPDILSQVTTEDLRNFGMIPEFLGRLPVLVSLQGLTKELLMRILKEPKNAILKQYERLLALDEVKLVFEDDALEWIAERALEKDTGARALRAILEDFMMDIMYEIPKDPNIGSVVITRPYLEKKGGPRIEMRG